MEEKKPEAKVEPDRQHKQETQDIQSVRQSQGRRQKTSNDREDLTSAQRHMRLNTPERKKAQVCHSELHVVFLFMCF